MFNSHAFSRRNTSRCLMKASECFSLIDLLTSFLSPLKLSTYEFCHTCAFPSTTAQHSFAHLEATSRAAALVYNMTDLRAVFFALRTGRMVRITGAWTKTRRAFTINWLAHTNIVKTSSCAF